MCILKAFVFSPRFAQLLSICIMSQEEDLLQKKSQDYNYILAGAWGKKM